MENLDCLSDNDYKEIKLIINQLLTLKRPLSSQDIRTKSKDNSSYTGVINQLSNTELIDALKYLGFKVKENKRNRSFIVEDMSSEVKSNSEISSSGGVKSNGIYSVLNNSWIKEPVQTDIPDINQEEFDKLFTEWEDRYFDLLDNDINSEKINDFIEDLYDLRKESITKDGEYGLGNLVFKEFRNLGYLDNLKELKNEYKSKELSLESFKQ